MSGQKKVLVVTSAGPQWAASQDGYLTLDESISPDISDQLGSLVSANTFALVGDSLTEYNFGTSGTISSFTDNGDGTATAAINVGAVVQVGDYVRVNNATATKYNTMRGLVTSIVANTSVTYQMTEPVSPVANSGGYFVRVAAHAPETWRTRGRLRSSPGRRPRRVQRSRERLPMMATLLEIGSASSSRMQAVRRWWCSRRQTWMLGC